MYKKSYNLPVFNKATYCYDDSSQSNIFQVSCNSTPRDCNSSQYNFDLPVSLIKKSIWLTNLSTMSKSCLLHRGDS